MRFPVVRERVRIKGRSGIFRVLSIDRARGVASVAAIVSGSVIEADVPLASILPLVDKTPTEDSPRQTGKKSFRRAGNETL